jgi:ribosomal protein L37E
MKRWRCPECAKAGVEGSEWEDFRTLSYCRNCGHEAVHIVDFVCTTCDTETVVFWDVPAPSHPCPKCGSDAFRAAHAPYVASGDKRGDYAAADRALVQELESHGVSTTTLQRPQPKPSAADPHWVSPGQVLGGGARPGGILPFGLPRPVTRLAGVDRRTHL